MPWQALIRAMVCNIHQNLKALLEHNRSQEIVGGRCVWRNNKERHFFLAAQFSQVNRIVRADVGNGWDVERAHTQPQRHIDALRGLAGSHLVELILLCCKGVRFVDAQVIKQQVQLAYAVRTIPLRFQHKEQRHNAVHVPFFRLQFIEHIADQCFQQRRHAFFPYRVGGALSGRILLQIFDKVLGDDQNVILIFYVGEKVVVIGFIPVFQVEHLNLVSLREQHIPIGIEQFALRITEHIVTVKLQ